MQGIEASYIYFQNYLAVYNIEKEMHLKMCPKLTYSHFFPTNFEKMRVSKAAQLFSGSMARAIKLYSNDPLTKHLFKGIISLK